MNSIKSLRARLGVTQEALAAGIGVTQGNVSNYERGQQVPPEVARKLIAFAHGLGHRISFDDVYGPLPELPRRRQADQPK